MIHCSRCLVSGTLAGAAVGLVIGAAAMLLFIEPQHTELYQRRWQANTELWVSQQALKACEADKIARQFKKEKR